jgi:hypothetical protein
LPRFAFLNLRTAVESLRKGHAVGLGTSESLRLVTVVYRRCRHARDVSASIALLRQLANSLTPRSGGQVAKFVRSISTSFPPFILFNLQNSRNPDSWLCEIEDVDTHR